jgi:parvulin-like peptidyl-prolyl isomerase
MNDESTGFYMKVLDDLIGNILLYRASVKEGLTPSKGDVDGQLNAIRGNFPSEEQFVSRLSAEGMTVEKLETMIGKDMAIRKLIETQVMPNVNVTEEAKKNFYEENKEQMTTPEQAKLSHILVRTEAGASPETKEEARKKAEGLHQQLEEGVDFATLARENSDDPGSKERGGDLDWVSRGQTVPPFEQAAFGLSPGEISNVVETQFGYHIIKLEELRAAAVSPYDQVEGRINDFLRQQLLQEAIQSEVDGLRSKADVEIFIES